MALYEQTYRQYTGPLTPAWSRFQVIPRYAYRTIFQSKLLTGFFVLCFVCPLIMTILIYLHHNVSALAIFGVQSMDLLAINSYFFRTFVMIQGSFGFVLTVLIGPGLISRDLTNNALPLYLCRPFSRAEYVFGKMTVLLILLSAITWVPGLLLFLFQSYLEGWTWLRTNLWLGGAILLGSWVYILALTLLSQALSAWIKWRVAASAALVGLFLIPTVIATMSNGLFRTCWGSLISLSIMLQTILDGLFRQPNTLDMPPWMVLPGWGAWLGLGTICALCLLLLSRKVQAYEVVRG